MLKLTTDRYEATSGLFATVELLVVCSLQRRGYIACRMIPVSPCCIRLRRAFCRWGFSATSDGGCWGLRNLPKFSPVWNASSAYCMYTMLLHGTSDKGRLHNDDRYANRSSCVNSQIHCFQTGRHSSYRSHESNMFDSCDPTDDRRDVWRLLRSVWQPVCKLMQSIWPLIGWLYINGLYVTCWLY